MKPEAACSFGGGEGVIRRHSEKSMRYGGRNGRKKSLVTRRSEYGSLGRVGSLGCVVCCVRTE